jgi:hypothetical protein
VTIPFTFLFARELLGTLPALLTALLEATSRWHLIVGRRGLRFPFPPLFGAATFYLLFRALRSRRRNDFLLCGLALGIGLHTYIPLRIAPLGLLGVLAIAVARDVWRRVPPRQVQRLITDGLLLFLVTTLIFMPLGRYAYDNMESFLFRGVSRIAGDNPGAVTPSALSVFLENNKNALLMWNWKGDSAWVNNIAYEPFLDPVSGALFVLGAAYALYRLIRHRETAFLYLGVLLFVALLPSTLSIAFPGENPGTARMGAALPITMLLVTLPILVVMRVLATWLGPRIGTLVASALVATGVVAIFGLNLQQYFVTYNRQFEAASQQILPVADAIHGFLELGGTKEDVHIVPGAYWVDTRSVAAEGLGDIRWPIEIKSADEARAQDGVPRPRIYILHPDDKKSLDTLRTLYPGALVQEHVVPAAGNKPYFITVIVPAGATAAR